MNFVDSANNVLSTIYNSPNTLNFDFGDLPNGFNVLSNGTTIMSVLSSGLSLAFPYTFGYTTPPTLTSAQVGYSYGATTPVSYSSLTAAGSTTIYNSLNQVALPVGVYYITVGYIYSPSGFTGTVGSGASGLQIGYCLGTSATPSSNVKTSIDNGISNVTTSALSTSYAYSEQS